MTNRLEQASTDTKAVARWDFVLKSGWGGPNAVAQKIDSGAYVAFTDHEQVVAELRSALAAKSAEVEGLRAAMFKVYCVAANGGKLSRLHIEIERMRNAMEKSNEHQDQ